MRAGTLTIEDNSVTVESTIGYADGFFTVPNGNGTTLGGVAVGISQHTTNLPIKVAISGGTFSAKTGCYAFYETDLQDGDAQDVAASVTGGSFTGKVYSKNLNGFISGVEPGGSFSEALPAGYFEDGYAAAYDAESGRYEVVSSADTETYPVLVERGDTEVRYASLVEAFAAAKDGDIVRLVGAAELNERIQLKSDTAKALTLDLNGQMLKLGAGLGETSALWVGANVTLTIQATDGGTIDGTGMDDVSVPVSAMEENAAVIIKGGTIVVNTDHGIVRLCQRRHAHHRGRHLYQRVQNPVQACVRRFVAGAHRQRVRRQYRRTVSYRQRRHLCRAQSTARRHEPESYRQLPGRGRARRP